MGCVGGPDAGAPVRTLSRRALAGWAEQPLQRQLLGEEGSPSGRRRLRRGVQAAGGRGARLSTAGARPALSVRAAGRRPTPPPPVVRFLVHDSVPLRREGCPDGAR